MRMKKMAAIDKLHLSSYHELISLKKWAIIYYPELLSYIYDCYFNITAEEFQKTKERIARDYYNTYQLNWKKVSPDNTLNGAIAHLMSECGLSEEGAVEDANEYYRYKQKSEEECINDVTVSVMNTPLRVDRKLKWRCPLPCIRMYLQSQCGVKEHWYYKLFWRGKKEYSY